MVAHRGRQRPEKIGLDTGKRFGYHAPNRRLAMVAPWPNDARVAVMFTFDFDAESGWLSRDPSPRDRPGVISQGTYGAKVGVPRILDLLKAENVPATFFIPGWVVEHHPDKAKMIRDAGYEIGHHGYLHERAKPEDPEGEKRGFELGMKALESVLGDRKSTRLNSSHGYISYAVFCLKKKKNKKKAREEDKAKHTAVKC